MPSRVDLYNGMKQLLLSAGAKTVLRGFYDPVRNTDTVPGEYPICAIAEMEPEQIIPHGSSNAVHEFKGAMIVQAWMNVGASSRTAWQEMEDAWARVDKLHDDIVTELGQYFAGDRTDGNGLSNTTVVKPKSCEYHYWFEGSDEFVGFWMRVDYNMNFA